MFNHRFRYIFILALSLYTLANTLICNVYYYFDINIKWYHSLLTILIVTLLTWEGNRLLQPTIKKIADKPAEHWRFLVSFFLVGLIVAACSALVAIIFVGRGIYDYSWQTLHNPLKLNLIYSGLINLFFHLLNAIHLFFSDYKKKREEAAKWIAANEQAKFQLLKNQINPHFVFNNLNVLSAMVIRDNPDANKFIEEFARVYRYLLHNQDHELVSLEAELEFAEPYIYLLKKRFLSGLNVVINIPEKVRQLKVVPASLQIIIENAIKHNIVSTAKPLTVTITIENQDFLAISNNLQPRKNVESSFQIGLENINKRYFFVSGREVVVNRTNEIFQVLLPLLTVND